MVRLFGGSATGRASGSILRFERSPHQVRRAGAGARDCADARHTGTLDRHFIANGVFANLAKDHRAIAIDLRGHGKSGKPHDPQAYGEEMARDVVRLLDHLKIQRAHVLGYSLGAIIAGRVATMQPERLTGVIYIASLPLRGDMTFMDNFAAESVKDLESDLPFKSLMVALQPAGAKPPVDDEVRKAMAPLVAANDVKALAALWRGYDTLDGRMTAAGGSARAVDRDHRQRRHHRCRRARAEQSAPANQDAGRAGRAARRAGGRDAASGILAALREFLAAGGARATERSMRPVRLSALIER